MRVVLQATNKHYGLGNEPSQNLIGKQNALMFRGRNRCWELGTQVLCLVTQFFPTLCDAMDCIPPGSSVHGDSPGKNSGVGSLSLFQGIFLTQELNQGLLHCRQILYQLSHQGSTRILEWVAYPFSRGTSWPRNWTVVSCIVADSLPAELSGNRYILSWIN